MFTKHLKIWFAFALLWCSGPAWADECASDAVAQVVATLGRQSASDADAVARFAAGLPSDSPAAEGLIAAIDARNKLQLARGATPDGVTRARQILDLFGPSGSSEGVFTQLRLVKDKPGFVELVVSLGSTADTAKGSAAALRWATTRMAVADISAFEFAIDGAVADIRTVAGDILEFKAHTWADKPQFLADKALRSMLPPNTNQLDLLQAHALSEGRTFFLVFENPVRTVYSDLFDQVFGDFLARPNVTFVDGF
jgi:hypothetical protein